MEDDMMTDQQIAEAIGRIARAGQLGLDKGIVGQEQLLALISGLKADVAALKARPAAGGGLTAGQGKQIVRDLVAP